MCSMVYDLFLLIIQPLHELLIWLQLMCLSTSSFHQSVPIIGLINRVFFCRWPLSEWFQCGDHRSVFLL